MEERENNLPFSVADDAVEECSITSTVSEADYMETCSDNITNNTVHFEQHINENVNELQEDLRVNNIKVSANTTDNVVTATSSATLLSDRPPMSAEEQRLARVNAIMHKLYDKMEKSKPSLYISLLESHTNSPKQSAHMQCRHEKVHAGCCGLSHNHKKNKSKENKEYNDKIIEKHNKINDNDNKDRCELTTHEGEIRERDEERKELQKEESNSHAMASQTTAATATTSWMRSSQSKTNKQSKLAKPKMHISNNILTSSKKYYQAKQMKELHPLITDEPEEGNINGQEH